MKRIDVAQQNLNKTNFEEESRHPKPLEDGHFDEDQNKAVDELVKQAERNKAAEENYFKQKHDLQLAQEEKAEEEERMRMAEIMHARAVEVLGKDKSPDNLKSA